MVHPFKYLRYTLFSESLVTTIMQVIEMSRLKPSIRSKFGIDKPLCLGDYYLEYATNSDGDKCYFLKADSVTHDLFSYLARRFPSRIKVDWTMCGVGRFILPYDAVNPHLYALFDKKVDSDLPF